MNILVTEQLMNEGLKVYLRGKEGTLHRALIQIERRDANTEPRLVWNQKYSMEFSSLTSISQPQLVDNSSYYSIFLQCDSQSLTIEIQDQSAADETYQLLIEMHKKATYIHTLERDYHSSRSGSNQFPSQALQRSLTDAALLETSTDQLRAFLSYKEGFILCDRLLQKFREKRLRKGLSMWLALTANNNKEKMIRDRDRWRLHASANLEADLQAWYHALFSQEVYRLRGHFWYKDAVLPTYRSSYDLVDNALTALEEAALAHILCSPDTTYGDVAGQIFVTQSLLSPELFQRFHALATEGIYITKHPRQGRPAKKLFRFSFVEGNIYLTWKGKFGNQGVGISDISGLRTHSPQPDLLRWAANQLNPGDVQAGNTPSYLSVVCADRSIDLAFDTVLERDQMREILQVLVQKEKGELNELKVWNEEKLSAEDEAVLYSAIYKPLTVAGRK
jgi:hypothetical protein